MKKLFLLLTAVLLTTTSLWAEEVPYVIYEGNGVLAFKVGEPPESTDAHPVWSADTDWGYEIEQPDAQLFMKPAWIKWMGNDSDECAGPDMEIWKVRIDPSFASARFKLMRAWFQNMGGLTTIEGIEYLNTSECTSFENMFEACLNLKEIDVSHFDVRNLKTAYGMFFDCTQLKKIDLTGWNTANLKSMGLMFGNCESMTEVKLPINTSNVTNMRVMFYQCRSLKTIDLSSFNTSKVTGFTLMFQNCESLEELDLSHFDTSNAMNVDGMFRGCTKLRSINLSSFDLDRAVNADDMFCYCDNLAYIDLSGMKNASTLITGVDRSANGGPFSYTRPWTLVYLPKGNTNGGDNVVTTTDGTNFKCDNYVVYPERVVGVAHDFTATTVSYNRTLKADNTTGYAVCLPFDLTLPDGAKAFTLSGGESTRVSFTQAPNQLTAYTPYLVTVDNGSIALGGSNVTVKKSVGVSTTATVGGYAMVGSLSYRNGAELTSAKAYTLQSGNMWKAADSGTPLDALTAYLTVPAGTGGSLSSVFSEGAIYVTAKDVEITYGDAIPTTFEYTVSGGTLDGVPEITCEATDNSDAGQYVIKVEKGTVTNASFEGVSGTLTINKALLTATADDKSCTYGDSNPTFTVSYEGFKKSQTASALTKQPTASSTGTSSGVGTYPITLSGGEAKNYDFNYVEGTLTVSKATLTVKGGNYQKNVGEENPEFSPIIYGFKNGEDKNVLTKLPVLTCAATKDSPVGEYDVVPSGAEADNYDFHYVNGTLTVVDPNSVVVTVEDKTRAYGDENPAFTYTVTNGTLTGEPEITCEATPTSEVGEYEIVATTGTITNGSVTFIKGTLTVEKAPLTVKAGSYTKNVGEENPEFTLTYEGFKNSETDAVLTTLPTVTCDATANSPAGEYVVTVSGGAAVNYVLSYENGTLTVVDGDGIETLTFDAPVDVYTLTGRKVATQVTSLRGLRRGVYIIDGKKYLKK